MCAYSFYSSDIQENSPQTGATAATTTTTTDSKLVAKQAKPYEKQCIPKAQKARGRCVLCVCVCAYIVHFTLTIEREQIIIIVILFASRFFKLSYFLFFSSFNSSTYVYCVSIYGFITFKILFMLLFSNYILFFLLLL